MKKLISLILVLVLAFSLCAAAFAADVIVSPHTLSIDGKKVECRAYAINGHNYYRLRELASALSGTVNCFNVWYDAGDNAVVISTGEAYADPTPLKEYNLPMIAVEPVCTPSTQKLIVDGKPVTGIEAYAIDGYNYFKLRDLQPILGFGVDYDDASKTVVVTTKEASAPVNAGDYAEVYAAICSAGGSKTSVRGGIAVTEEADAAMPVPTPAEAPASGADNYSADESKAESEGGAGYSGTNVQVDGIDEGDIVKTDGTYIYILRDGEELLILKADGADTSVISRTKVGYDNFEQSKEGKYYYFDEGKNAREMFVSDGRLAVISDYYSYTDWESDEGWKYESENYACVDIYDVRNPTAPKLLGAFGQDGSIRNTRMADGKVYAISTYWVWNCDEDDPSTYVPVVYSDGMAKVMPVECVYINPCCNSTEYVVICSYDLASAAQADTVSLLGGGDQVYMNDSDIYVFGSRWTTEESVQYQESVYDITAYVNTSATDISRFDLNNGMKLAASGSVPGYMDSQFSADEYQGYLRMVTTRDDSTYRVFEDKKYGFRNYQWDDDTVSNGLYILDGDLNIVGSVENLAADEYVYSARFDGNIAYFCTYRSVDPLFAVDCSNPTAPKVLSALKISGFSDYLHSWGSDRLFGFGQETNEETGWNEGLKLVMFNTADKTNVTVENYLVLDASYSEALYNHKAFFIDKNKNIIGFLGEDDYYIFSYTPEEGFKELSHFWFDTYEWNVRGLWIGDWAYIVGREEAMLIDMTTWDSPIPLNLN